MDNRKFNDQEQVRRNYLKELQASNNDPFINERFIRNHNSESFKAMYDKFTKEELHESKDKILIAGRVMSLRQTFGVIKDFNGSVQFYLNKNHNSFFKLINYQKFYLLFMINIILCLI